MPAIIERTGTRCENHWYCKGEDSPETDHQKLRAAGWRVDMFSHWVGLAIDYTYRYYCPTCTKKRRDDAERTTNDHA